jgi:hypothetical protein
METVALLVLGLLPGLVLGYLSAMPRVLRLERELVQALEPRKAQAKKIQLYQVLVKQSESDLVRSQAEAMILESELEKVRVRLSDSELELVRVKKLAHLRESELEMALDLARAQVLARE